MSPDKKHMAMNSNKDTNDLNLVPFKSSMPSNMPIGWIPVFSFNKLNQMNIPFSSQNFSAMYSNPTPNLSSSGSMSSLNVENYPSDENINNLYSYNKANPTSDNTYKNPSSNINRSENISEVLRNYTADLDENVDLCRHCLDKRIDKIYDKIQEKDPEIISLLVENYKIPCPIAKIVIRKIIKLSLKYCKKAGD